MGDHQRIAQGPPAHPPGDRRQPRIRARLFGLPRPADSETSCFTSPPRTGTSGSAAPASSSTGRTTSPRPTLLGHRIITPPVLFLQLATILTRDELVQPETR
ncbi:hypothetical protein IOD13_15580 [Brevibacterium casei]|nr:hypothetical protein [Brevibacterium casei]